MQLSTKQSTDEIGLKPTVYSLPLEGDDDKRCYIGSLKYLFKKYVSYFEKIYKSKVVFGATSCCYSHTLPWSPVPSLQRASSQFPAHYNSMKNDWRALTGSSSGFTSPDTLRPSAAQQEDKLEHCPDLDSAKECEKRMPKVWEFHLSYFSKEFQTCDKRGSNRMCAFLSLCMCVFGGWWWWWWGVASHQY